MQSDSPAEAFPPGEFLKEELEARQWTQTDLAEILGRSLRVVNEIVSGRRAITPETAKGLGQAFGTSAEFWLNLEASYQLWRVRDRDDKVRRRARLYELAPVNDMIRRGWIKKPKDVDALEGQVCAFLGIRHIDEDPRPVGHAARKSTDDLTREQSAWIRRVHALGSGLKVGRFDHGWVPDIVAELRKLAADEADVVRVPRLLAEAGVRFLVVEHLPKTRIDGVCVWLDKMSPVIALSLRYDRIDGFWHTLLHEIGHVRERDGLSDLPALDVDIVGEASATPNGRPASEQQADSFAAESLIPQADLNAFIRRSKSMYSASRVIDFAFEHQIHPGIVVGQLQHRGAIPYSTLRRFLVPVRSVITGNATTDGWIK